MNTKCGQSGFVGKWDSHHKPGGKAFPEKQSHKKLPKFPSVKGSQPASPIIKKKTKLKQEKML